MRAQLARGDRAAALRSYGDAVAALRRELAMEPGSELEQLAARARTNA
jgi:DNA-binding SARP family transcriptional activator